MMLILSADFKGIPARHVYVHLLRNLRALGVDNIEISRPILAQVGTSAGNACLAVDNVVTVAAYSQNLLSF